MYVGQDFSPADQVENQTFGLDFVNDLSSGDSISSATVSLTVAPNSPATDPSPSSRFVSGPFTVGTVVSARYSGFLPNVTYILQIVATTGNSDVISLFSHIAGEAPF